MSLVNALQNGKTVAKLGSNADVTINLGYGNAKIEVEGKDVDIDTECGDHVVLVDASGDFSFDAGHCGIDVVKADVKGNAEITTRESDDYIDLKVGGKFIVNAGCDEPPCLDDIPEDKKDDPRYTDNDIVKIRGNLEDFSSSNFVSTGEGTDNVRIIANNTDVKKGDGDLLKLGIYGDNNTVNTDAKHNIVGFWGDDFTINGTGQGYKYVKTFDEAFKDKQFLDFGFEELLDQETYAGKSVDTVITERLTGKDNLDDVAKQYNLTDSQVATLRELDLTKTTEKGNPYYLLYKQGDNYQIGYRNDRNQVYSLDGKLVTTSSSKSSSSSSSSTSGNTRTVTTTTTTTTTTNNLTGVANLDVEREKEITKETYTTEYYNIDGVKNTTINFTNNGKYEIDITASDGFVKFNGKDVCDNDITQNIRVKGGYVQADVSLDRDISYEMEKLGLSAGNITKRTSTSSSTSSYSYNIKDPLILDTNKDGIVSTIKTNTNYGIDINGDGIADGAGNSGDKMLAMSDMNNTGTIDGTELFGDGTVSPFTGKKLNAANGFEALKMIALEAKQYVDIDCMNGDNVDIQKLAQALARVNVRLGLVGGNNNTSLEGLGDIQSINVAYRSLDDLDTPVQHRQQSTYTTTDGKQYKADDVVF